MVSFVSRRTYQQLSRVRLSPTTTMHGKSRPTVITLTHSHTHVLYTQRRMDSNMTTNTYPAVMLRISCLASCWCFGVKVRLCVGVEVATSGRASELRATWVKIGGILLLLMRCPVSKSNYCAAFDKETCRLLLAPDVSIAFPYYIGASKTATVRGSCAHVPLLETREYVGNG